MHTTLDQVRLAHRERLARAETGRAARATIDHRRAERLEARAARLRERAERCSPGWAPTRAGPATIR